MVRPSARPYIEVVTLGLTSRAPAPVRVVFLILTMLLVISLGPPLGAAPLPLQDEDPPSEEMAPVSEEPVPDAQPAPVPPAPAAPVVAACPPAGSATELTGA